MRRRPRNLLWLCATHGSGFLLLAVLLRPWTGWHGDDPAWEPWAWTALVSIFVGGGIAYISLQYRYRRRAARDQRTFGALADARGWRYEGTVAGMGRRCAKWLPGAGPVGAHVMHMGGPPRTLFETSFAGSPLPHPFSRVPLRLLVFLFGKLALLVFMFPGLLSVTCCIGPAPERIGCLVMQEARWRDRRAGRTHQLVGAGYRTSVALERLWSRHGRRWGMTWEDGYLAVWHIGPMTPRKAIHAAELFATTHQVLVAHHGEERPDGERLERVRFRRVSGSFRKRPVFRVTRRGRTPASGA